MALRRASPPASGIGRARELAAIAQACDAARDGRGTFLVVSGEPGIGKTWLLDAAASAAEERGLAVGWGSCWPIGDAPPLWPWRQAVTDLCGPELAGRFDPPGEPLEPTGGASGWFGRYVAIVDELRWATAGVPGMLLVDDLHAADEPSRNLAGFLARHVRTLGLVVVVAHASGGTVPAPPDLGGSTLALRGLEPDEVASVLVEAGALPPADDLDFIVQATRGHPVEVRRVASSGPDPVRSLVEARIAALPPAVRDAAARASVLEDAPRVADLAAVADLSEREASRALVVLERHDLARRVEPDRVAFSHHAVPPALRSVLDPAELLDTHARAVELFEQEGRGSTDVAVRRAEHALAVGGRSPADARHAIEIARDTAETLADGGGHRRAAALLEAARGLHEQAGLGQPPASLLAAEGTALLRSGRLGAARAVLRHAAGAADAEDDHLSRAVAAIGYGGVWLNEMRTPLEREWALELQRRALAELPGTEPRLRCRLEARLAAERAYTAGQPDLMAPALEQARGLGDPLVLAEALALYHHTLLGPEHADRRLDVVGELLAVATRSGDELLSLTGLCWLTVDRFLAGDPNAPRSLGALRERSTAAGCPSIGYIAAVMDVTLLTRAGRLEEAEARAEQVRAIGAEVGDADALAYYGAQLVIIRWLQGRSEEVCELAADTAASPTLTGANLAFTAVHAALAADCGDLDQARAALVRLRGPEPEYATGTAGRDLAAGAPGLEAVPSSSAWLATMFAVVEAAHVLGDVAAAQEAAALLEPFAHLPVIASLGAVCLGSTHRALGLAALSAGDAEAAVARLEAAIVADQRFGHRPMAALTRADLARALLARSRPGDREAAREQLDRALSGGEAMGLVGRTDQWRRLRRSLEEPAGSAPGTGAAAAVGVIRRQGPGWLLAVGDRHEAITPDLVGMAHLSVLLRHPGQDIAADDLAGGAAGVAMWEPEQAVLDDRALAEYRRRISDLEDDIAEAEEFADGERAARARVELDGLVDELARTTDVFGRTRSFSTSAERARTSVRKAVRRALDKIEESDPALGSSLRRSVRTGRTCRYDPVAGAPERWVESAHG